MFEKIIRKLSIQPVRSITVDDALNLHVHFENNDMVTHKITLSLRVFFITVNSMGVRSKSSSNNTNPKACTKCPVGFFDLFGFRTGDIVTFHRGTDELSIEFS
jgi:hypothetical protein